MRFPHGFINIWPLEFLGFPLGSLWEYFSDIWVSIGDHLGVYWIPLGTLWIPLGTLLDHFGITLAVLGPPWALFWWLWHNFGALWLQKEPKKLWREVLGVFFVNSLTYYVSLDEQRTITGVLTKCFPLTQLSWYPNVFLMLLLLEGSLWDRVGVWIVIFSCVVDTFTSILVISSCVVNVVTLWNP